MACLTLSLVQRRPIWFVTFVTLVVTASAADAARKRSAKLAGVSLLKRMLILEGAVRGLLLEPEDPADIPPMPRSSSEERAPMRVLFLTPRYPTPEHPFVGTFIRTRAESLIDAGVDVEVVDVATMAEPKYRNAIRHVRRRLASGGFDLSSTASTATPES